MKKKKKLWKTIFLFFLEHFLEKFVQTVSKVLKF